MVVLRPFSYFLSTVSASTSAASPPVLATRSEKLPLFRYGADGRNTLEFEMSVLPFCAVEFAKVGMRLAMKKTCEKLFPK